MEKLKTLCSLGQELKKLREAKDIPLDVISEKTNLKKDFILSLEQENFHKLPTMIHARGFLKTYTQFLGVPSQEFLDAFDLLIKEKQSGVDQSVHQLTESSSVQSDSLWMLKKTWIIFGIGLVVLLMVSLVVCLLFFGFKHRDVFFDLFSKRKTLPVLREETALVSEQQFLQTNKNVSVVQKYSPVKEDQPIVLSTLFMDIAWISVKVDGELVYEGSIAKGGNETWTAKKEIRIQTSCSQNISFLFNGQILEEIKKLKTPLVSIRMTRKSIEFE